MNCVVIVGLVYCRWKVLTVWLLVSMLGAMILWLDFAVMVHVDGRNYVLIFELRVVCGTSCKLMA